MQDGLTPDQAAMIASIDVRQIRAVPTREEQRAAQKKRVDRLELEATLARLDYDDLRSPGDDDVDPDEDVDGEDVPDKPRTLGDQALRLSVGSLRAPPPAREYLLRDVNTGAGMYVRGAVGMLAAAGGTGKSYALTQLCVAVATGTTWLGVGGWAPANPARVLGLFGEEDAVELERRIHYCARAAGLTSEEDLQLLAQNFTAIPLMGHSVALTTRLDSGERLPETRFTGAVREMLWDGMRESRPYDLIVMDPLSRFAGSDVETDNNAATRWVEVVESLTLPACGGASAIVSHHTKKRGENDDADSADGIRGASGLVNGVRWAARLEQQKRQEGAADLLTLKIVKANGVAPQFSPLVLIRDQENEGALRIATRDEIDSHDGMAAKMKKKMQTLEDVGDRILRALADGVARSRNELLPICGCSWPALLTTVKALIEGGDIEQVGSGRKSAVRIRYQPVPQAGIESGEAPSSSGTRYPTTPEGGGVSVPKGAGATGTGDSSGTGTEPSTESRYQKGDD
jgi:hypothetical protein